MDRSRATKEVPLLNLIAKNGEEYISESNRTIEDDEPTIYDVKGATRKRTHCSSARFEEIYNMTMKYYTIQEKYLFKDFQLGNKSPDDFFKDSTKYLQKNFVEMNNPWDYKVMMNRLMTAMFGFDVVQPLIDHPDTSDIKICSPYDIRVRIKGKAYKSNAFFIDEADLYRFVEGLSVRNRMDIMSRPVTTFTDTHDPNYILRFTVSSPMVCAVDHPYLHIRKVPKNKPSFDDLIKAKMLTPMLKQYLIDRAKLSRGIIFAGPPGSGKTTALNAFIEYIPKTRESLVIQENDELQTQQSGFMFKHVCHGFQGEPVCTLEDLGQMALVEGCNEFIIGEVKGAEMRNAMTLLNAGGYAALTVHSTNAYETLDKCADLVKYGSSYSFEEARRMLKTFDTIVYMEGYKIREILECTGYEDGQYKYINIYRYEGENENDAITIEENSESPDEEVREKQGEEAESEDLAIEAVDNTGLEEESTDEGEDASLPASYGNDGGLVVDNSLLNDVDSDEN